MSRFVQHSVTFSYKDGGEFVFILDVSHIHIAGLYACGTAPRASLPRTTKRYPRLRNPNGSDDFMSVFIIRVSQVWLGMSNRRGWQ